VTIVLGAMTATCTIRGSIRQAHRLSLLLR
jgi:hypothetical protein